MNERNLNPELELLKVGKIYRTSKRLDENFILLCTEVENSNAFVHFKIVDIIKQIEKNGIGKYSVGQKVRWRRDWYRYNEIDENLFPEYYI